MQVRKSAVGKGMALLIGFALGACSQIEKYTVSPPEDMPTPFDYAESDTMFLRDLELKYVAHTYGMRNTMSTTEFTVPLSPAFSPSRMDYAVTRQGAGSRVLYSEVGSLFPRSFFEEPLFFCASWSSGYCEQTIGLREGESYADFCGTSGCTASNPQVLRDYSENPPYYCAAPPCTLSVTTHNTLGKVPLTYRVIISP